MKPLVHARLLAARLGSSTWQDWIGAHTWFDRSKSHFAGRQHRMFFHSDFGVMLAGRMLGDTLVASSDGTIITTTQLAEAHITEDLGRVPSLAEWLRQFEPLPIRVRHGRIHDDVLDGPVAIAQRFGGCATDYQPLWAFFRSAEPFAHDDKKADHLLHNTMGIFLAEELLGAAVVTATGAIVPTRTIGEAIVTARMGYIPTVASIAKRTAMTHWMRGSEVGPALTARKAAAIQNDSSIATYAA